MKTRRWLWVLWYGLWYPFVRIIIILDYIPRRLLNGWGIFFQKTGILAGLWISLVIVGLSLTGIPFLILWHMGRRTYFTHYRPKVERLHADFYAAS